MEIKLEISIEFKEDYPTEIELKEFIKEAILKWGCLSNVLDPMFPDNINEIKINKPKQNNDFYEGA